MIVSCKVQVCNTQSHHIDHICSERIPLLTLQSQIRQFLCSCDKSEGALSSAPVCLLLLEGFSGLNYEYRPYLWGDMSLVWCTSQVKFSSFFCGDEGGQRGHFKLCLHKFGQFCHDLT